MNKDNKHPLDPEELFKRLGDNQAGNGEPLDDFEKEALEGFAMLGDEQQARDAYQEVLVRLSKKNDDVQKPSRKTRVVWLSAAAVVAAILITGIIWLNDQHGAAHENLAMNTPEKQAPKPAEEMLPPAVETEEPVNEPAQTVNAKQKEVSVTSPDLEQAISRKANLQSSEFEKNLEDKEQTDDKPQEKAKEEAANNGTYANGKNEANTGYYGFATSPDAKQNDGQSGIAKEADDRHLAKAAEKADKYKAKDEEKDQDKRLDIDETASGNSNNAADVVTAAPVMSETANNKQETVVTKNEGKKRAEKANNNSPAAGAAAADFKSTKEQEAENIASYYTPGEKALKDYLVTGAGSKALSGTYTVKASATNGGKLKVASVIATSGACSDCAQIIKKLLDGMAGWTPSPGLVFNLTF